MRRHPSFCFGDIFAVLQECALEWKYWTTWDIGNTSNQQGCDLINLV